jgi:hypothetical protein
VKAFVFRLQQALAWRETELNLQRARVAAVTATLASVESAVRAAHADVQRAATLVPTDATGLRLDSYAAFRRRSQHHIRELEAQALAARKAVDLETKQLVEANRKVRVLENLRTGAQNQWQREFDRELADFADEAFLQGISRRARSRVPDARPSRHPATALPTTETAREASGLPAGAAAAQ